jgi:polar amino acid transport system substrate-binding protein
MADPIPHATVRIPATGPSSEPGLETVLPVAELQSLLDAFNDIFPAVTAILDRDGRVLQASGWQDICTKFHRATPGSCRNCTESDTWLAQNVKPGEFVAYHCKNGLNDVVTPLHIGGVHAGNLYTGQFFFDDEPVDEARFREQAKRFGFDEGAYLEALRRVPRVSRARVEAVMGFIVRLTSLLSKLGQANRQLAHDLAERQRLYVALAEAERNRRAIEASMQQAQKLESLGLLAGGIAHDFNNLLTSITGSIELARAQAADNEEASQSLALGLAASQRAAELTRQLLAYSGRGRFEARPVELVQLITENAELWRTLVPRSTELVFELAPAPCGVEADRTQLQQVIANLLTNAAESGSARVTLRTGAREAAAEELARSRAAGHPKPGRYGFIEVTDTGCGMDAQTLERTFEPFFTTKTTGRGLGMAAVHGIVSNHGGALLIDSALGRGTKMTVLLPWVEVAAPAPRLAAPSTPMTRRVSERGELLVVDDEPMVASALARLLQRMGYLTHLVHDGPAALAAFGARRGQFKAAIIDVTMPGMSGPMLAERLHALAPALPIVLTSGFDLEQVKREQGAWLAGFLPKPYSVGELEAVLDRISARAG